MTRCRDALEAIGRPAQALTYLESGRAGGWDALYAGHCGECGWWTPPFEKLSSAAFQLGGGLDNDKVGKEHFLARRSRDVGCGTLLSRQRDQLRGSKHVSDPKVMSLPKVSKGSDPAEVAKAVRRRVVQSLGGDTAVLATAVDPRCAFAVVLRYTSRVARLLHTAVSGDGLYKAVLEPRFDLTLARMASERSLRTFVVWPPVVHLQRDDDDTPTDGYGGNSSRFIEAYLGMDER